ncbi:MAG: beta-galactosidase [Armatimonadetes bacterium]|nr:beta-galactosidase [Armatimonadota bacterium]MDW8122723.1 beta-galactosidase [Armatimonadota bacterium]
MKGQMMNLIAGFCGFAIRWIQVVSLMLLFGNMSSGIGRDIIVGIFHDREGPQSQGAANPQRVSKIAERIGLKTVLLSRKELSNPDYLHPDRLPIVLFPNGPYFPAEAVNAFRDYLKKGGRFLSLGGYAFDYLYGWADDGVPEDGTQWHWRRYGPEGVAAELKDGVASVSVPRTVAVGWYGWRADLPLQPGASYLLEAEVFAKGITSGAGAYLAAEYFDEEGKRITFQQTPVWKKTTRWETVKLWLKVPEECNRAAVACLVHGYGRALFRKIRVRRGLFPSLNSHWAVARDKLHIEPDQLALFDPGFRIDGTVLLEGASPWIHQRWRLGPLKQPLKGLASVGLIGSNDPVRPAAWARLMPLVYGRDRFGRFTGPVLAVLHHFAGPYKGSSWAFCGVENRDLTHLSAFNEIVGESLKRLAFGCYLYAFRPNFWTYRPGEVVVLSLRVRNAGLTNQIATLELEIRPSLSPLTVDSPVAHWKKSLSLGPGREEQLSFRWTVPKNPTPLYVVHARLRQDREGLEDELRTGFCVWQDDWLTSKQPVRWHENALEEWDAKRKTWVRRFWLGTNQTGVLFAADWENPFQWDAEFYLMRKMGLNILRVLHISVFAGDLENPTEEFWRRYDALVLMAHRHDLVLMPCLHDWTGGVTISDHALQQQATFVSLVARRYRRAPRIVWDIENEARDEIRDLPDIRRLFNQWLRDRYPDQSELKRVWGDKGLRGEVPFRPLEARGWDDRRVVDLQHFRRWLIKRWIDANVTALRQAGARQPVTDEIDWKVCGDHYEASQQLTFTNLHYYGDRNPLTVATYLKYMDRQARGHGLSVGEFGARDHPSFIGGWGYTSREGVVDHYIAFPIIVYYLGGAFVLNWDWKDMEGCIFPWGLIQPHGIAIRQDGNQFKVEAVLKASGQAFCAISRVLGRIGIRSPRRAPITVVLPDDHLLGPEGEVSVSGLGPAGRVSAAVFNSLNALLRLKVPFDVIREWELPLWVRRHDRSHPTVALFPIPFIWSKQNFQIVKEWVITGGQVIISGDFTFLPDRTRRDQQRVRQLCGLTAEEGSASPLIAQTDQVSIRAVRNFQLRQWRGHPFLRLTEPSERCRVLAQTDNGQPVVVAHSLGEGLVLYSADAPEFRDPELTARLYAALLHSISGSPISTFAPRRSSLREGWALEVAEKLIAGHRLPHLIALDQHWHRWIPLRGGTMSIPCHHSRPVFTVRDLMSGRVLTRVPAMKGRKGAVIRVPEELAFTLWSLAEPESSVKENGFSR